MGICRRICLIVNGLVVLLSHVADQFEHFVGVAPFVVVPRNELDKVFVEHDAGVGIEDGGVAVADEVGRNDWVFGVAEYAFEFIFGGEFHSGLDFIVGGGSFKTAGEVHDGNVQRGHAEGHAGKFALQ